MDVIKCGSLNVRGLNEPVKRAKVLYSMHKNRVAILLLQETHFQTGKTPRLNNKYYPKWYHSTNQMNKTKGTSIALHKSLNHTYLGHEVDTEGRCISEN